MVLHPLTEVRIGVLMPVRVGCCQLVVHVLRNGKGREPQKDTDDPQCHSRTEQGNEARLRCCGCHHEARTNTRCWFGP